MSNDKLRARIIDHFSNHREMVSIMEIVFTVGQFSDKITYDEVAAEVNLMETDELLKTYPMNNGKALAVEPTRKIPDNS